MDSRGPRLHWLTAAVAQTGLLGAMTVDEAVAIVPAGLDAESAWHRASAAFGLSQEQLAKIVAQAFRLESANTAFVQPEVRAFVPESIARELGIVPIRSSDVALVVATSDPMDGRIEARLNTLAGRKTTLAVAGPTAIAAALERLYGPDAEAEYVLSNLRLQTAMERVELPAITQSVKSRASAVEKILRLILFEASAANAEEIQLAPSRRGGKVQFVVDGEARTFVHLPVAVVLRVMARLRAWYPKTRPGQPGSFAAHINGERHEFRIRPSGPDETAPIRLSVRRSGSPAKDPGETASFDGTDTPVALVVDDEPGARLLLSTMLRRGGFRVLEAVDGVDALNTLQQEDVDVLLLDLAMPRMDGFSVLRRVRSTVRTAALPVVIITASEDPDHKRRLLREGADDYIQKPIDPPRVSERVKAVLKRGMVQAVAE